MFTYMESVEFGWPRSGAMKLLEYAFSRACDDAPAQDDWTLRLWQNDIPVSAETVLADLDVATFTGYADIVLNTAGDCAGFLQGPAQGSGGEWRLFLDQQTFEQTGTGAVNDIYGAAIFNGTDLIAVVRFEDAPLAMDETGNQIKLNGELILLPQMP